MTEHYDKLKRTLQEVFQLDQADLDFGIYRIMNQKRDEINEFLEKRLLKQVEEVLASGGAADSKQLLEDLAKLEATLKEAGMNPGDSPKVKELNEQIKKAGNPQELANEVFSHLASFFRRYYDKGDFISQRRYKKDVYAIPYEGEEVKLHWANHDQYYIKSSEYFRNYIFKLDDGKKVAFFALREASTEQNNNKAQDKNRLFKLADEDSIEASEDGAELKLWFHYEPMDKKVKQEDLTKDAVKRISEGLPDTFKPGMLKPMPTPKNPNRTLLEKHLTNYTARNTFDYFIHKDLDGYLSRELDFYIKNEILYIDDINLDKASSFDKQLKVIKSFKSVAHKIITFLAQLENFQKKLWLKKKMIVQCDYCITLDRVPEKFYEEIATNELQRKEWVSLFSINKIEQDLHNPGYSEPLTESFLKTNPFLVLDTKFFSMEFKYQLLGSIENIDDQFDGLLANSDNFQALNLFRDRFSEQVKSIYIDPPYNTGGDDFIYKDRFQESSWLSMMLDRVQLSKQFMKEGSTFSMSIDIKELDKAILLNDSVFYPENRKANITVKRGSLTGAKVINPGPINISENVLMYSSPHGNWDPPRALREKGYDTRYGTVIINPEDNFQQWKFSTVLEEFSKEIGVKKSQLRKNLGSEFDNMLFEWVLKNSDRIIRTASLDENSIGNDAVEAKKESLKKPNEIIHLPREDANDYYILNGGALLFYKHRLSKLDNRLVPVEPVSDIWDDVLPNDLHNEGGVELRKGKKPEKLIQRILAGSSLRGDRVLDYFLGSGTATAVAQKMGRKWIGIDSGHYFNEKSLRRMKNVLHGESSGITNAESWRGGGSFKYVVLESYEDSLNNLELTRSQEQAALLSNEVFSEEYLLHYLLDVESQDGLLKLEAFKKPFGYKLKITENNELKEQEVDLIETFNYLIGLVIESQQLIKDTVVVQGRNLEGDKILVIWRNVDEMDNEALNDFFFQTPD